MLNVFLFVASCDRIAISVGCGDVGGVIDLLLWCFPWRLFTGPKTMLLKCLDCKGMPVLRVGG